MIMNKIENWEKKHMTSEYIIEMKDFYDLETVHTGDMWLVHPDDAGEHPLVVAMYCYLNQYNFCKLEDVVEAIGSTMWDDDRENCCWIPKAENISKELIDKVEDIWEDWNCPNSMMDVDYAMGFGY